MTQIILGCFLTQTDLAQFYGFKKSQNFIFSQIFDSM